jgi:Ca-activated chloride channel family protein
MLTFADPYALLLLLPLGVAAWWVYRRRITCGLLFAPTHRLPPSRTTWRTRLAACLPGLVIGGIVLAIVALARPRTVLSVSRDTTHAIAIEMVVDVSGSMEALDLSERTPTGIRYRTRLDAVKETFADFVEQRPSDLVGLITFGGYATTRAPLTTDHRALLHVLSGVEIPSQDLDEQGRIVDEEELLTAIGDALATACARLQTAEPESRVVVLLSDGESNTGIIEPEQALAAARELGIKVYTIGVGSSGQAPFPARDMFGRQRVRYAHVSLDEVLLRRLATETGGRYFNVKDPDGLAAALQAIDRLETTEIEQNVYYHYDEWFPWFVGPAVTLILLGTGLNMLLVRRVL